MGYYISILIVLLFISVYFLPTAVFAESNDSSLIEKGLKGVVDETSRRQFLYGIDKWRDDLAGETPSIVSRIPIYAGVGILTLFIVMAPWIIIHRRQPFHNDKRKIIFRWLLVQAAYLVLALISIVILHLMGYAPNLLDALVISCVAVFVAGAVNISYFLVTPEIG